jgi:hypothetical protein
MITEQSPHPSCLVGQCYLPENEAERIRAVFGLCGGAPLPPVNGDTLRSYHDYLAAHLSFPFSALYAENTSPIRRLVRCISILGLQDVSSRPSQGILCRIEGAGPLRELPLAEIGVRDDDPNYRLIDDYACWFSQVARVPDWQAPSGTCFWKGAVMAGFLETNWQLHLGGVKCAAESLAYRAFPELAERAKREAEEFGKLPTPKNPAEMALLIAKSSIMQGSWNNEFLSRAATQANADMLSNTQKVIDALLHQPPAS